MTSDWMARIFAKESQPTDADRERAMDLTIRAMARDAYNPNALRRPETATPANAPKVQTWGWAEARKIGPVVKPGSMEERVMSDLIDRALPPGGEKKDRK